MREAYIRDLLTLRVASLRLVDCVEKISGYISLFDILLPHLLHLCIDRRQLRRSSRRNHSLYVDKLFFVDTESDLAPDAFVQLDFQYPKFCVFLGKFVFKGIDF